MFSLGEICDVWVFALLVPFPAAAEMAENESWESVPCSGDDCEQRD